MASKTLNISVPEEMFNFLINNKWISPSAEFQKLIVEIQEVQKNVKIQCGHEEKIESLEVGNDLLKEVLKETRDTIQKLTIENERLKKK